MGDQGSTLADFVKQAGPLRGQALHRLAVSCVAALAKLHARGTTGIRPTKESVALGAHGQVLIGWQTVPSPGPMPAADDVRAWADLVVFAATGTEDGDLRVLTPALRIAIQQCRLPDPAARPKSVDVLRVLLSRSMAAAVASVDDLLSQAG
ncbi:putative serine/threonine protein kinase [[Actinomadura] parvosata subsp. kistnae]|uniref:Protein kinase domain-containing protein n=1 Tax=[Actinomadura] parvosata subsp. kistnae TaxID=1909395 RepID=A0A1V0AB57_9ACTN|nr:hypothetical protein [Nonomuraea sp. ATCC 55076]AQZ67435.1 hypothetical protein BKM31_43590 [Nonomuraea sp. ATCC 55076]SPL94316.1 putative serine/threonine protein kinase [Actinomadura parvosata subsp. kistnae]